MLNWTPMRWPGEWKTPAALDFLKSTPINYLLIDPGEEFSAVREAARARGLTVSDQASVPKSVKIVKGQWPGIRTSEGGGDNASAGPTGEAWVESNGWRVAIERAVGGPALSVWVDGRPRENAVLGGAGFRAAVADTAAMGGRWILALNDPLARAITEGNTQALETWNGAAGACGFFAKQAEWANWAPRGVIGVVSDFSETNALVGEVVNLVGRAGSQCRAISKSATDLRGVKALVYADAEAPEPDLRKRMAEFVRAGGMLIVTPVWGAPAKGIHVMPEALLDPYTFAREAVTFVSRRYDLVRLWNAGGCGMYASSSPDGRRMLAQLMFYWDRPATEVTAWVAGEYRSAKLFTIEGSSPVNLALTARAGGAEMRLPEMRQYAAIELERK